MLADEYLRVSKTLPRIMRGERLAFFLGAVSPDIFFYDFPSFTLTTLGNRLHRLMESEGLSPIHNWLADERRKLPAEAFAWGLGFASHVLADSLWHPAINEMSGHLETGGGRNLSKMGCHRLVESEMEAYWFPRRGVEDGYLNLMKWLVEDRGWMGRMASVYRLFLRHTGLEPLPSEIRIRRCFLIQNRLLRMFSKPVFGKQRDRLLGSRAGRYFGSLIVPAVPVLRPGSHIGVPANRDPFSNEFMNSSFISLSKRLAGFEGQLSPFLPS